jgi:pheromone shutdown protein TraB
MKTELCIIGAVHHDTNRYCSDDIVNMLKSIKPDIILLELYSKYMDKNYNIALSRDILNNWQEFKAVVEYKNINKNVQFRPFDLKGRNEIYKEVGYLDTQREVEAAMEKLYKENKLTDECKFYYELWIKLFEAKLAMVKETPQVVNSNLSMQLVSIEHYYWFKCTEKIIELTPQLSSYSNFKKSVSDIWVIRNNAMVNNILKYINEFAGKKLVVLVGAEHKHDLCNDLAKKQEVYNYVLKEFWEF